MNVRLIKHEVVPNCGSYELRLPDGRPSKFFYFENLPSRRLRPGLVDHAVAERVAKLLAAQSSACWIAQLNVTTLIKPNQQA
jgi:hypothetical protein